jgi:SepF-like predicted cell division protein (DUF552 family)
MVMKKSDLKLEIKKYISEILSEDVNEAIGAEVTGKTGKKTVASFKDQQTMNKFKTENPNIASVTPLEEKNDNKTSIIKKLRGE